MYNILNNYLLLFYFHINNYLHVVYSMVVNFTFLTLFNFNLFIYLFIYLFISSLGERNVWYGLCMLVCDVISVFPLATRTFVNYYK